jgi:hypothetical protein
LAAAGGNLDLIVPPSMERTALVPAAVPGTPAEGQP